MMVIIINIVLDNLFHLFRANLDYLYNLYIYLLFIILHLIIILHILYDLYLLFD